MRRAPKTVFAAPFLGKSENVKGGDFSLSNFFSLQRPIGRDTARQPLPDSLSGNVKFLRNIAVCSKAT